MKNMRIAAIIAIVAILLSACAPQPENETLIVPEWAEGEYTGTVMGIMDSTLKITEDSFRIDLTTAGMPFMTVDSAAEGTKVADQDIDNNTKTWNVVLDGASLGEDILNDISVTIVDADENQNVTVLVPEILGETQVPITFTPASN